MGAKVPESNSVLDQFERASILVLGSGTSVGVPMVGCQCKVCHSDDPRDRRLRPSVLLKFDATRIVIDTGPDFRYQALRYGIERLDAILYTHAHADHILGLDDVRPFNFMQRENIPIFASADTLQSIESTFSYVFQAAPTESSRPRLSPTIFDSADFCAAGVCLTPIRLLHGKTTTHGFRFGDCAYLTDHNAIPEESMERLNGLDVLFLDALRLNPHPTHSTIEQSLTTVEKLKPKRAFFTHLSHDVLHANLVQRMPPNVTIAYDGLEISIGRGANAGARR